MKNIIAVLIIFFSAILDVLSEELPTSVTNKPYILEKYDVNMLLYNKVLTVAKANSNHIFKTNDILAIIGIESSWNPKAKSKHGAVGLTQIVPKYWKFKHDDIESQIETTFKILKVYFEDLKNKDNVIIAYNCGLTNFKQKKCGKIYLKKFNKELKEINNELQSSNFIAANF